MRIGRAERAVALACRANATFGVNVIEPSCDLRTSLGPGDWLRVGHNESHGRLRNEDAADLKPWAGSPDRGPPDANTHVFTVVAVAQKPPYAITLSSPWPYASDANVALYEQGRGEKGERDAYRYVVTFDTLLGDLPPAVARANEVFQTRHARATKQAGAMLVAHRRDPTSVPIAKALGTLTADVARKDSHHRVFKSDATKFKGYEEPVAIGSAEDEARHEHETACCIRNRQRRWLLRRRLHRRGSVRR